MFIIAATTLVRLIIFLNKFKREATAPKIHHKKQKDLAKKYEVFQNSSGVHTLLLQ